MLSIRHMLKQLYTCVYSMLSMTYGRNLKKVFSPRAQYENSKYNQNVFYLERERDLVYVI